MGLIPCIVVSTLTIILTMFVAQLLREVAAAFLPKDSLPLKAFNEFLAAAEMCGCGFELIIIADNYGVTCYAIFLFLLTIWWSDHWNEATACPYLHFEDCLQGRMSFFETTIRTLSQTIGGLVSFHFITLIWTWEFAETHVGRSHSLAFDNCSADLKVPVLYGAIIEGLATMLCRLTTKFLTDNEPKYANAIDSFVATALVIAAFDYSGGYYNPVLATGLKYGCKGHSTLELVLVYWIGSSLGAIASIYVYPLLKGKAKEN